MSRYIDTDILLEVIDELTWYHPVQGEMIEGANETGWYKSDDIYKAIDAIPSADVIEVVRCKNCKHWQENTEFCSKFSTLNVTHRMPPWAFCCLGERKEQDHDR